MICEDPLFLRGIEEFRAGEYYRCHDTLEELWMDLAEPEKTFVQGILQVAVGCYHLTNANEKGCMILLGEGIKRLKEYQPEYETIDVKTFVLSSAEFLDTLQSLTPEDTLAASQWIKELSQHCDTWQASDGSCLTLPMLRQVG